MNVLLALDGVLSSTTGDPIRAGAQVYYALNATHRVALITERSTADAEQWLASHGIVNYDDLLDSSYGLEGEDLKKRQFITARSRNPVDLYVDNDPAMIAWVFEEQGVTGLLFACPGYLPVRHRPDAPKHVRTWQEIQEAVTRNNIARSKDKHVMSEPDLIDWEK